MDAPQLSTTHRGRPPTSRVPVLRALDLFDKEHAVRLTTEFYYQPEVEHFSRAIRAVRRDLDERDTAKTAKQRQHMSGRVLRSVDAAAAAARRLSEHSPWLTAKLYDLAFEQNGSSWRALRRQVGSDFGREGLSALRWALYRGKRASSTSGRPLRQSQ